MLQRTKILNITLLCLILCLAAFAASIFAAENLSAQGKFLKGEQLTKEQFKALPDNALIEFKGQQKTKGQIIAEEEQKSKQALAKMKNVSKSQFEAARAKFLQEQKAKIEAANAKAKADFNRLKANSAKYAAIKQEALQLFNKSKTAPPAEQEQIEKRANELLQQLKQIGY